MIESVNSNSVNKISPYLIRRANPADAEQIVLGINAICSEGESFYTTRFVNTPQWDAVLYHPETVPDHFLLVAEWNGRIVGAGRLFPGGEYTLFNHVAELGIFVLKPFRRQKFGTQLLTQLMLWATQSGLEKITLATFSTNLPAILFFEKQGFLQEGQMRNQIKIENRFVDLLLMGKFLPSA
jgi:RimJ/RimL family protein N-acetyltransferase